ncbi:hypothetical protein Tco_0873077 [Tanacetum coccineum]
MDEGESSALRKSTVIRLRIPQRRSTRLIPPTPILTIGEADDRILQDTIQLSLAEQKSRDELEAKENVQKVKEHLIAEEIEKLVEGAENVENVEDDSSTLRQDDTQNIPGTRLEPKSNKESPEVEITAAEQPVNVIEEEEESAEDDYELGRREKGKHVEESRSTPSPTTIRSLRTHYTLISSDTKKLQELTVTDPPPSSLTPSSFSSKSNYLLQTNSYPCLNPSQDVSNDTRVSLMNCKDVMEIMEESLPTMVDGRVKELTKIQVPVYVAQGLIMERQKSQADVAKMIADAIQQNARIFDPRFLCRLMMLSLTTFPRRLILRSGIICQMQQLPIWLALKYKFERLHAATTPCKPSAVSPRDQDDPHDDAHPEGENSAKRQKTSDHGTFVFGESSFGQDYESKLGPSTSGNQEQLDDFDFWTGSYAIDDDEIPTEKVSQELVNEMSHTIDEAKLRKVVDEMLRQRCTLGDEHQYHIDQMQTS